MKNTKKIDNVEAAVLNAVRHFEESPVQHGDTLFAVAKQEGYEVVRPYIHGLLDIAETPESYSVAVSLAQPDWTFYQTNRQGVSMLVIDHINGSEHVAGHQKVGEKAVNFEIPHDLYHTGQVALSPLARKPLAKIKRKLWKSRGRYFVVAGSKDVEALKAAHSSSKLVKAPSWGFLSQFKAYVVTAGPFLTKEAAKQAR
jgi:hypothetical protein